MNLNPRLSFLATTAICALPFVFAATQAQAENQTIGTVESGTAKVNSGAGFKNVGRGAAIKVGDKIKTGNKPIKIALAGGGYMVINANTSGTVAIGDNGLPTFVPTSGGGVVVWFGGTGGDERPFLGAFGFGNASGGFPSIGGGSNSANGTLISHVLPGGQIALFDSAGNFVKFQ